MARKRGKAKAVQQAPSAEEEEEEGKKSIYERVYEEVYGRVPFPPSPLDTARNFAETVISPSVGGQSLLLAVAALIPMYLIGYTERHLYDLLGYVAVLTFPAYLCVWTVTYLASFTVVAGLLALVGNTLWWHASLRSIIISPRAMAFYALAATLYMVACKLWVGLLVGWAAGLFVPAVAYLLSVAGPVIVYLAFTSSILLIILALLLGFIFVVMAIGALVFMALSLVSAYWSRYASTITPLWRVFAVWLIVTAKQLLPPQVTYLLVAGYAVYAGFQAALTVGGMYRSYQYLNALPAVILVALTPVGAVSAAMETVTGVIDQTFSTLAPSMGENSSILVGQYVAKWILSHVPPW